MSLYIAFINVAYDLFRVQKMIEDKHTNKQAEKQQSYFRKAMALTGYSFMVDSPRSHAVCT